MRTVFTCLALLCTIQSIFAQKDVYLKINHQLGAATFALNQTATNNLSQDFQVTRLEYYISDIVLHHDGTQTAVANKTILANGNSTTNELLGNFNVQMLDSISFGIGVGPTVNHLDPSTYPAMHPLAPKSPSMHWGWTSGYRFIAFEGVSGASMSDVFQMHSLGDPNYNIKTIGTNGMVNGSDLEIILDADYSQALKDINISGGVVSHGETGAAKTVIDNFNAFVFSDGSSSVPITILPNTQLALYPNPVKAGNNLTVELENASEYRILIYDAVGKLYQSHSSLSTKQTIQFNDTGLFILNVLKGDHIIHSQKVSINE